MKKAKHPSPPAMHDDASIGAPPIQQRVLDAAFEEFAESGYDGASTLKIATRASASKRELYSLFGNKQGLLLACIESRARQMRLPLETAVVRDRKSLAVALKAVGVSILRGVSDPVVLGLCRLAIAEAERTPAVAEAFHTYGRKVNHAAIAELLATAQKSKLLGAGDPSTMATQFLALLSGEFLIQLLLGLARTPSEHECERLADEAAEALLALYPK